MTFHRIVYSLQRYCRPALGMFFAASLVLSVSIPAAAYDDAALRQALHKDLQDYLSTRSSIEHISTLSMDITFRGSKEEFVDAIGTTKYGGGQPVTPDSLFQIGSNTKAFTSAILLRMEAHGVLCIDDNLGKWLPQYPAWSKVTIRELLNMTSGISTYDLTPAWTEDVDNNPYRTFTPEELVAYIYPNIKTPGAAYEYSNTNYILAQMIIDKASWFHSYKAEVDRLIEEEHLHNTYYEPDFYPAWLNRRLVSGYYVNTDPPVLEKLLGTDTKNYSLGWAQAAGGMLGTPMDLTRWIRRLFEGDVLEPKQKQELESLVSIPDAIKIPSTSSQYPDAFGLGVSQITAAPLGLFWFYEGSTIGYRAAYAYIPASGLIICVYTNSQAPAAVSTVDKVLIINLFQTLKSFGKI
jgi:D-alanyl-D-alanine carboxypeptidase